MNRILIRCLSLAFMLLANHVLLSAQKVSDFTFFHIGQAHGMASQRIYSILQTSDGAVWWSSKNGVERFNGVDIHRYQLGGSDFSKYAGRRIELCDHFPKGMTSPDASAMVAFDNKGRIYTYDAVLDKFTQRHDVGEKLKGLTDLNDILPTKQGYWLATNKGVCFLHENTLIEVASNYYANYFIPTDKSLLVCTRQGVLEFKGGLSELPKSNSKLRKIVPYDVESGYYDYIYKKVWLGGYASGVRVLSEDGTIELAIDESHNPVRAFYPYDIHSMLVGIDGKGVYRVDRCPKQKGEYAPEVLFNANEGVHGVLHGNGIYALIRDIWGNIFVGSYSGGVDMARPVGTTVAIYKHIANDHHSLLNDHVNSVCQSTSGKLLMGTDNGVSIYDPKSGSWTHTCHGTVVVDLLKTPRGTILAATYGQGVMEITEDGQSRSLYNKANEILQDDHVFRLYYDRDGNLWVGGLDGDLLRLSADGPHYYPIHYVKDILQLPDGQIAVATTYGIKLISPENGKISELVYAPASEKDVNGFVHTLFLNSGRELWIGTDGGGIYVYDLTTKQSRQLTTKNGLPSNFVNTIYCDTKGRIIIATEQGLSFADPKDSSRIIGVNYCYGVDREYASRAAINLDNGYMALGSTTGALVVNPNHIQEIDYTAKLYLKGINSDDGKLSEDRKREIHQQLARNEVKLSYGQRTFELYFESINLRNQSDIGYQYKVDKGEWSKIIPQQYIRFTSMEPGKHTLVLRCVSRTCGAVLDEVTLSIKIGYPWWNTWWMWCIYIILLILLFYGAWRVYRLHDKYMRLVVDNLNRRESLMPLSLESQEIPEDQDAQEDDESSRFISQATRLVVDNISDSEFTIDRLCREMAMSRTLFYVKLKSYTGKSPQDFIRIIRLERAAQLLRSGRQVTDAATLSGFDNPKYFSTVFKKYFGVSPSKYQ